MNRFHAGGMDLLFSVTIYKGIEDEDDDEDEHEEKAAGAGALR